MRHVFTIGEIEHAAWLARRRGQYLLHIDDQVVPVALAPGIEIAVDGDDVYLHIDGATHHVRYHDPVTRRGAHAAAAEADVIEAPMPGVVTALQVTAGASVQRGETLLVIESMKLETAIKATRDAVVAIVHVAAGQTFDRGAPLVTLALAGS